uniref:TIGR02646 family protein n=1 Tax=Caenorhabditis tropicalis TaxID=1561998 RepID=A0A1I7TJ66_9PELO
MDNLKSVYDETLAKILKRFPNVTDHFKYIVEHVDEFEEFENRLKLKNVFLRAISFPEGDSGTLLKQMGSGKVFFHWGFYDCSGSKITPETVHYHPQKPVETEPRGKIFKKYHTRKDITYSAYMEFKANVNCDFKVPKNYFVPDPDPTLDPGDVKMVAETLMNLKNQVDNDPSLIRIVRQECEEFIKNRFDDYLEDYHNTNNDYYLQRADFYRKLKVDHMILEHQLLVSAAHKEWFASYFIEGELRDAYSEKIESL